ncbi:MAG: hypothetical protein KF850_21865 [Labilithrix sp.]|nr:hypothetical protein [Labilithrix sp.]
MIDAVDIALDVCDELANAHVNGIVHGDLGLHRVRTHWPRVPKQRADIFALGENDSAAFAFRASAVSILVAPEQRAGAAVDTRVDVWAVGAILHWLIAGVAPSADPLEQKLARAPRTLVITVAACLAEDPGKRPQSVNEIAEALGSFASSPADRFEQLARRRALIENAKRVRSDLGDVDRVLGRLDDAALARELASAAAPPSPPVEPAIDRLALAVHESTGSLIFDDSGSVTDLVDEDDDASDAETVLAQPSLTELHASERGEIIASPLSISPVVLSSELLAPPKPPVAPAARRVAPVPPVAAPERTKRSTVALAIVGAALAVSLGVGIGMHLVEGALARHDTAAADVVSGAGASTSGAAVSGAGTSTSGAAVSGAGASVSGAGTSTSGAAASGAGTSAGATLAVASPNGAPPAPSLGASPATEAPSVMSVTSLPDARPLTPSSLPDARPLTPSSLPDARPAAPRSAPPARANAAPRPSPPRAPESAAEGETVPAGFKSFDGASR